MLLDRFVNRINFESYEDFAANFRLRIPERFNFAYDVIDVLARETPAARALVWVNDLDERHEFSFADMKRESDRAANLFRKHGIGKGDVVMLILKGRYEFWFCILALHKLGAIAIPATHMLTEHDLDYRITSADVKMIVSVEEQPLITALHAAAAKKHPSLETLIILRQTSCAANYNTENSAQAGAAHPAGKAGENQSATIGAPHWMDYGEAISGTDDGFVPPDEAFLPKNTDYMLLYFTSGTVGNPKMVRHDFAYPLAHIITAKYWQNVEDGGLHYTVADTGWAKAVWGKLYGQWLAGSAIFVYDYDKFNALNLVRRAAENGVTTFCAPPTIYRFLIKQDLAQFDLSALKYCVIAGEPLNPEVYEQFLKATGHRLHEGYGQTETILFLANYPWDEPKPGSMGRPAPGYKVVLLNSEGKICESGEEGEVCLDLSGDIPWGLFSGYHRDQERTDSVWYGGYYHTGDAAWRDEDGYYWFVGRMDDVIKTSGYRVGPFEVESALIEHPAVLECAITGVPDPDRGQVIKATVVLAAGYAPNDALKKELQDHVKRVTAPYKYPRIIEFADALPKTISGKIRRVEIRNAEQS
ncbi:MAG: AMP-binding protein [Spirochaetota bacterium]|jgi:acetyl-CoA synthetase|nr:AMP-binding protein [Spirochaetota bacterium]